eukprot:360508-Chlamydomonas_euryale.AAC.4
MLQPFPLCLPSLWQSGWSGRPRSTWRNRALVALRPVLTSLLAWLGWYGGAQDRAQWHFLRDSAQPAI